MHDARNCRSIALRRSKTLSVVRGNREKNLNAGRGESAFIYR